MTINSEPTAAERLLLGLVRAGDAADLAGAQAIMAAAVAANEIKIRTDGTLFMARQDAFRARAPKYGTAKWGEASAPPPPPDTTTREAEIQAELDAMKEQPPGRSEEQRIAASDKAHRLYSELLDIRGKRVGDAKAELAQKLEPLRAELAEVNARKPLTDQERCERAEAQARLIGAIEATKADAAGLGGVL